MKRLLFVSHAFPPSRVSESLLVVRTVSALQRLDWQITLLTVSEKSSIGPTDNNLLKLIPPSVEVVRSKSLEKSLFSIPKVRGVIQKVLCFLGLPEKHFCWYPFAVHKGMNLIKNKKFDVIHSWSCSHTSNVIGLALKRATGLPWIAHFSDPWVDSPYFEASFLQRKSCVKLEESIIRKADALVFVTQQTVDLVMRKYPSRWKNKVHVIPHGYDANLLKLLDKSQRFHNRLKLVYTGSFYPDKRTPVSLLKALATLKTKSILKDQIDLVLIGANTDIYRPVAEKLGLNGLVSFHGPLSFIDSLQAMQDADVLVAIDAPSSKGSVFLPSKLVDYMMFKKPILGITSLEGASADLLRRLECPVVDPDDVVGIARSVLKLFKTWKHDGLCVSRIFRDVASEYTIEQTTKTLNRVLHNLISCTKK